MARTLDCDTRAAATAGAALSDPGRGVRFALLALAPVGVEKVTVISREEQGTRKHHFRVRTDPHCRRPADHDGTTRPL